MLNQPIMGQPLIVYLAVGEESISAVLVREDGREQYLVYFVSKVLRGAEIRYPEIEKVSLALINDFGEEIMYMITLCPLYWEKMTLKVDW